MIPDEWKWISVVGPVINGGSDLVIYIFDTVGEYTEVRLADMEMEVFTTEPDPREADLFHLSVNGIR